MIMKVAGKKSEISTRNISHKCIYERTKQVKIKTEQHQPSFMAMFHSQNWFLDEGDIEMEKVNVRQQPQKCVP